MWCMQILRRTSRLSIKDKPQTLWYLLSIRILTEEKKSEQSKNLLWTRNIDPDR